MGQVRVQHGHGSIAGSEDDNGNPAGKSGFSAISVFFSIGWKPV